MSVLDPGNALMLLDTLKLLRLGMSNPASRAILRLGDRHRPGEPSRLDLTLRSCTCDEQIGGFTDQTCSPSVKAMLDMGLQSSHTNARHRNYHARNPIFRWIVSTGVDAGPYADASYRAEDRRSKAIALGISKLGDSCERATPGCRRVIVNQKTDPWEQYSC